MEAVPRARGTVGTRVEKDGAISPAIPDGTLTHAVCNTAPAAVAAASGADDPVEEAVTWDDGPGCAIVQFPLENGSLAEEVALELHLEACVDPRHQSCDCGGSCDESSVQKDSARPSRGNALQVVGA